VALCGIPRIDTLLSGRSAPAIRPGDDDRESVGLIQDLLAGHGCKGLPNLISPQYGSFGKRTSTALRSFCEDHGIAGRDEVDGTMLSSMVTTPSSAPIASRGYLTLVLDLPYTGLTRILSVVAQMEGAGRFGAINLNTDKAGLSFGLIQWAQKPGRLSEILDAFRAADIAEFNRIFGGGKSALASALLSHTRKQGGGVSLATGETTDLAFDLVREPWIERFQQAAALPTFQKAQVQTALAAFGASLIRLRKFASKIDSDRGTAFMIDLANQFGDGGARSIFLSVQRPGLSESELLSAMAEESVRRMPARFRKATQARRQNFLQTTFLADTPLATAAAAAVGA
jgi:hypothetical protein